MQDIENYIEIGVHNKIMQAIRQKQLQYKTKIIELEKQKQYEINRANEFQQKFKQAMLQSGTGNEDVLIQRLTQIQNQINNLRIQNLQLKKNLTMQGNSKAQTIQMNDLIHQNQEMARTIQQLKSAAISAIMSKDDQIQELNDNLAKAAELAILYQHSLDRQDSLEKQLQRVRLDADQQQKILSQKLVNERQRYLQRLQQFEQNLQNQEIKKQMLQQTAQSLKDNLQNNQRIIGYYQQKINDYQSLIRQSQQISSQNKQKLKIQISNLKDKLNIYQRQQNHLTILLNQSKLKEKQMKLTNDRLKEENIQLQRKLTIKKRKNNNKLKSSDIYSSFQGISQKSSFYSSFIKPNQYHPPSNLGEIQQMEENDVLENFIDLQQIPIIEVPNVTKKKSKFTLGQISKPKQQINKVQELTNQLADLNESQEQICKEIEEITINKQIQSQKKQSQVQNKQIQIQTKKIQVQTKLNQVQTKQSQNQSQNEQVLRIQIKQLKQQQQNMKKQRQNMQKQIQKLKYQIQVLKREQSNQKKSIQQLNKQLKQSSFNINNVKSSLNESFVSLQKLTTQVSQKNTQLSRLRQSLSDLRSQIKKSQNQKELAYQLETFKQHVFKLENALLIEKLQNAEKEQFMKERTQRERKAYDDKINKLNQEVKLLSPKKKKGFFR